MLLTGASYCLLLYLLEAYVCEVARRSLIPFFLVGSNHLSVLYV